VAKLLAISPHLDDAVLSYGGRLAELSGAGHEVVVYTVFAGTPTPPYSPAALGFHSQWELAGDPVEPRRAEDRDALAVLGVTPRHGTHLDAIYRRDEQGGWLIDGIEPVDYEGDEPALVADISATIGALIAEVRPDRMYSCAAMGNHVDHRRTRDAALDAAARDGVPLELWDDFPYVTWAPEIPALPAGYALAEPVAEALTPAGWEAWTTAVRRYESQLAMLEQDGTPLGQWYTEHCESQADRYGVAGVHEVVRRVAPAGERGASRVHAGAAGIRRHPDL
jgi:LmbE family N-acetylglucosaminyl deacetylase